MTLIRIERPMHIASVILPTSAVPVFGTDIVYIHPGSEHSGYVDVFPSHLVEMLSWLAGTQRMVVGSVQPILGSSDAVINLRQTIYQVVEDLYPGGLSAFLIAFLAIELEAPDKS